MWDGDSTLFRQQARLYTFAKAVGSHIMASLVLTLIFLVTCNSKLGYIVGRLDQIDNHVDTRNAKIQLGSEYLSWSRVKEKGYHIQKKAWAPEIIPHVLLYKIVMNYSHNSLLKANWLFRIAAETRTFLNFNLQKYPPLTKNYYIIQTDVKVWISARVSRIVTCDK
jgi:hypothetical protein